LSKIQDNKYENQFVDLVKNFLQHYKANIDLISFEQLKIDAKKDSRKIIFIEIFELIFEKYQQRLNESNQIDFSDMISNATTKINEKKYISPWKYIIIDEFQDLSQSRYQLINSLLIQNLKTKLFCVGDDWQSIYRFSGSDLNLMKSFRHYFGKATIVKLNLTFRFNDMIAYTSEKFIIKNKNQIIKNIYTKFFSKTPKIFIWYLYPDINKSLSIWIEKNKERLKGLNLQLLSRYTHSVEDVNKNKLDSKWYSDVLENITIHKSKGLESDVVIVTDLTQESGFGFPSMKEDDPILELLLPVADKYPYAEERRLMYVAMTRAKNETHLFTYNESPSKFIKELANKKIYKTEVYKNNEKINYCPSEFCVENKGIIMKKTYEKKISFECSLYPNCKYIPGLCLDCEQGFTQIPNMFCSDSDCSNKSDEDLCPKCKLGIMKYRENKYETKMKCSNYKQCDYKENLKPEPPPMLTDKEILNFK
jgi:DNA helicase-4